MSPLKCGIDLIFTSKKFFFLFFPKNFGGPKIGLALLQKHNRMSHVLFDFYDDERPTVKGFRDAIHKTILATALGPEDVMTHGLVMTREMLEECMHYPNSIQCNELLCQNFVKFDGDPTTFFEMFYNPTGQMSVDIETRFPTTGWGSVLRRFNQQLTIGSSDGGRRNITHILEELNGAAFTEINLYHCSFQYQRPIQITCRKLHIDNQEHQSVNERWITGLMNVFTGVRELHIQVIDYEPAAVAEGLARMTDLEELYLEVDIEVDFRPPDVDLSAILVALPQRLKKLSIKSRIMDEKAYDRIIQYLQPRVFHQPFELSIDSGYVYSYYADDVDVDEVDEEMQQQRDEEWDRLEEATVRFLKRLQFLNVRLTKIPTYNKEGDILRIRDRFRRARGAMLALVDRPNNRVSNLPVELQRQWLQTTVGEWDV
jgi:hypothetical protein